MIVITLDDGSHLSYNLIDNRYAVRPCVYKKSKYQNNKYPSELPIDSSTQLAFQVKY